MNETDIRPESAAPVFPRRGGMWDISQALWRLPRATGASLEERLALMEEEQALRDLQARYFDALDSGNLDAIMSFFHDDCVQIGPRGTFVGADAIRQDYEHVLAGSKVRIHYATNVAIRLLDGNREAWMSSRTTRSSPAVMVGSSPSWERLPTG
ncbi:MAG: YybH family protein [Acidimicrobiales bacterium]